MPTMGVNEEEEADLAAYQLKDVAQVWYKMWVDIQVKEKSLSFWIFSRLHS